MKKLTVAICFLVSLTGFIHTASGQFYFYNDKYYDNPLTIELGASIGAMNCLTDLGGRKGIGKKFIKDLNIGKTQPSASIYLSADYKYTVSLRAEASFGKVTADDAVLQSVKASTYGRYERNLSFRSNISEFMIAAEVHPLYIFKKIDELNPPPVFSPYLLAGVGFFSFKPQAKLNDQWIDLQPLSTEGQGFKEYPNSKPYKLKQMNIPVGVGIRYELSSNINLRAEMLYRILNTDYLDDVSDTYIDPTVYPNYFSGGKLTNAYLLNDRQYELTPTHITNAGDQRGNPNNNDAYFSFSLKVGYMFGREKIK